MSAPSPTVSSPTTTVIVPTHRHHETLAFAVRSILGQTVADLGVVIIGDGVTDAVRSEAHRLCALDARVTFEDHPKSPRRGELHRDRLIRASTSEYVAYCCDDDLWFPDHLETMLEGIRGHDFIHPLPVLIASDGVPFFLPSDLRRPESVRWHLSDDSRNTISLTGVVHTRDAYLRLPHGWRETPEGRWTDHYMWQQFFEQDGFSGVTSPRSTTLKLMAEVRDDLPPGARRADIEQWWDRLGDPSFPATWEAMVRAALWRSAVDLNLVSSLRDDEIAELRRELVSERSVVRSGGVSSGLTAVSAARHGQRLTPPVRILVVSTLLPPNFVSGGTLQPLRMAQGLRRLGHEVTAYAGWLGDRPPYAAWDDVDDSGMPIRWIATEPFHDPARPENWWNPVVTRDFEAELDRRNPDVVHFHALQGLGAGLVVAAQRRGIRTVVTMHDWWWFCGRLFLVDDELRRCSVVADCGSCPCAQTVGAARARRGRLREVLDDVDLVLVPASSMRAPLAANGLELARVAVNENSIPDTAIERLQAIGACRIALGQQDEVRFLFAGGDNALKGGTVLVEALTSGRLGRQGWSLTALGLDTVAPPLADLLRALPVTRRDLVDPGEFHDVLAEHDVLVLPSIARESFSILTREALAAGLVVITADSPGPLEVVEHERNGLVVAPGDSSALAAAMARIVEDPVLLDRLRAGVATTAPPRPESAQVAELESLLLADRPSASASTIRNVVFVVGMDGAPMRYRVRLPAEALQLLGIRAEVRHHRDPDLLTVCLTADVVVAYRVPATSLLLQQFERVRAAGIPIAFDVDDLIFDPSIVREISALADLDAAFVEEYVEGLHRYRTTLQACDAYIGSTPALVEAAMRLTGLPGYLFPNGIGLDLARHSDAAVKRGRRPGPLRFGYFSGSDTHDRDWAVIEPAVIEVLTARPDVELWVGGHLRHSRALDRFGRRIRRFPFVPGHLLPYRLRELDVNLAPLELGNVFNDAKSAIKWLEAALCLTPTIASPTPAFHSVIDHGVTGMLATTPQEWTDAILALLDDPQLGDAIAARARETAMLQLAPALQGRAYRAILETIVARGPVHVGRTGWTPVTRDEQLPPMQLEPYPFEGVAVDGMPAAFGPASRLPQRVAGVDLDRFWYRPSVLRFRQGPVARARRRLHRR